MAVGTLEGRSVIQSTRYVARHKARRVSIYEAEALNVDPHTKQVTIEDTSDIRGAVSHITLPYDVLVYAVGAETQTFGIPGVKEVRTLQLVERILTDGPNERIALLLPEGAARC